MITAIQIFLFIVFCPLVTAQCFKENFAFQEGEDLHYEIYYNWGFVWLNAGYVDFRVDSGNYKGNEIYSLDAYGASHKSFDWIFKVRDSYISYLDKETLRPWWFHRKNSEGGFEVNNKYIFDPDTETAYSFTQTSDRPYKEDTLKISSCTFDLISLVYYCRNLDFSNLAVGDSIPVISIIDNEIFELFIRYRGREEIETKDGSRFKCIKFSAMQVEGTIFKSGEDLYAWITDDKNRMPVMVEAKILIGSVKGFLTGMKGLRNPNQALVNP